MKVLVLLFILLFGLLENESFSVRHVAKKRNVFFVLRHPRANFDPFVDVDTPTTVDTVQADNDEKAISTVDAEETLMPAASRASLDTATTAHDEKHLKERDDEDFDEPTKIWFPTDDEDLQDFGSEAGKTTLTAGSTAVLPQVDFDLDGSGSGSGDLAHNNIHLRFNDDLDADNASGSGSGQSNIVFMDDTESSASGSNQIGIDEYESSSSGSGSDQIITEILEKEFLVHKHNFDNDDFTFLDENGEESGSYNQEESRLVIDLLATQPPTNDSEPLTTISNAVTTKLQYKKVASTEDDAEEIQVVTTEYVQNQKEVEFAFTEDPTEEVQTLTIEYVQNQKEEEAASTEDSIKEVQPLTIEYVQDQKQVEVTSTENTTEEVQTLTTEYVQDQKEGERLGEKNENQKDNNEIYKYRLDIDDTINKVLASPQHNTKLNYHGINDDYYIIIDDLDADLDDVNFVDMESESDKTTEKEIDTDKV